MSTILIMYTAGYGTGERVIAEQRRNGGVPRKGEIVVFEGEDQEWMVRSVRWFEDDDECTVHVDIGNGS